MISTLTHGNKNLTQLAQGQQTVRVLVVELEALHEVLVGAEGLVGHLEELRVDGEKLFDADALRAGLGGLTALFALGIGHRQVERAQHVAYVVHVDFAFVLFVEAVEHLLGFYV